MIQTLTRTLCIAAFVFSNTGYLHAAPVKTNCGALIQKIVITKSSAGFFETKKTTPTRITGAAQNISIPAGKTRCVKVTFTGGMSCQGNGSPTNCFIRSSAGAKVFDPGATSGSEMRAAYQWIARLGPGTHAVEVETWRTSTNANALVHVDDWVMDIEVLN